MTERRALEKASLFRCGVSDQAAAELQVLPGPLPQCGAGKVRYFSLPGTKNGVPPSSVLLSAAPIGGVGASLEAEVDGGHIHR